MAPKVEMLRCAAPSAPETPVDGVEYGYLQLVAKKKGAECAEMRWVSLPRGVPIHSYPRSDSISTFETRQSAVSAKPLRSCMRQPQRSTCADVVTPGLDSWDTASVTSTVASSNDARRVRFRDGVLPGSSMDAYDEMPLLEEVPIGSEMSALLAEWIFIDRDICGFSLYEFAPDDAEIGDFASSPYARMFLEELAYVEFQNLYEQNVSAALAMQGHKQEERQLDRSLLLAGVHVRCIHSAFEDVQESCELSI